MLKVFSNLFRLCGCKTKVTSSYGKPALIIKAENDVHYSLARKTILYITSEMNPNVVYETCLRTKFNRKRLFKDAVREIAKKANHLGLRETSLV